MTERVIRAFDVEHLNLILFPTEQCNFRCTYCYEDFEIGRMSPDVICGVQNLLSARIPELRSLSLSWFGGEPLLAFDTILAISRHVAAEASPSLCWGANVTTNGYLLDSRRMRALLDHNVTMFQVSLDGTREQHDRTRRRAGGQGSFDRIIANLRAAREQRGDFQVLLRIHFAPDNVDSVAALVDELRADFDADPRFFYFFKAIERLGGPDDAAMACFAEGAAHRVQDALEALVPAGQIYRLDRTGPYVCYASQANSLAVRADGRLAKCTVALADDRNTIGSLRPDGRVEIDAAKLGFWLRGFVEESWDTLACPMPARPHDAAAVPRVDDFVPTSRLRQA